MLHMDLFILIIILFYIVCVLFQLGFVSTSADVPYSAFLFESHRHKLRMIFTCPTSSMTLMSLITSSWALPVVLVSMRARCLSVIRLSVWNFSSVAAGVRYQCVILLVLFLPSAPNCHPNSATTDLARSRSERERHEKKRNRFLLC